MQECTQKKPDSQTQVLTKLKLLRNDKRVRATKMMPCIDFNKDRHSRLASLTSKQEGDAMVDRTMPNCETSALAFAHWQQSANEKAYAAKLITKAMYEFARDEIHKKIASFAPDKVAEARYNFE